MGCPDIETLLDLRDGGTHPAETVRHVSACPLCRGFLELADDVAMAMGVDTPAPSEWTARSVEKIVALHSAARRRARAVQVASSAILASLTALAAVVCSGAGAPQRPGGLLAYAGLSGALVALFRWRHRWEES